ncbi:MAG: hypothetical protein KDD35_10080, partial [Bdellovibrionales bacterium]|nr:hypothetical protein [Bdellovibrionales bacterium]
DKSSEEVSSPTEPTSSTAPDTESKNQEEPQVQEESTPKPSETTNSDEQMEIEFYRPATAKTDKQDRTRVLVSGKTLPGSRIWIEKRKIPYFTADKKIGYLNPADVLAGNRLVKADPQGFFSLAFDFPRENIQLTVKIAEPNSRVGQSFQLNIGVTKEGADVTNQGDLKESPLYAKKYSLWFGTGFNYLRYTQESADIQSDLEFQTFKGPSFFGRAWWKVNDRFDTSFEAKLSPGEVISSDKIQVAEGNYNWLIFAIEGTYYPENWTHKFLSKYPSRWGIRTGLQHHLVPFISRTGSSESEAKILTNSLSMFTVGFQNNIEINSKWAFEWYMRYQSPLVIGNVFQMLPQFAFDGSLGLIRAIRENWKLGVYWYGQWHDYAFKHNDNYLKNQGDPAPRIDGRQSLFFSNIELRAGYEFN